MRRSPGRNLSLSIRAVNLSEVDHFVQMFVPRSAPSRQPVRRKHWRRHLRQIVGRPPGNALDIREKPTMSKDKA
jgi:hypothetical protein